MKYDDARKLIQSGDIIGQIHGKLPGVKLIQIVTRHEWTHVAVTRWVDDSLWVYEAVQPLVRLFPLSKLTPFHWVEMGRELSLDARNYASSTVGHHYGLDDCIWAGLHGYAYTENEREQCAELTNAIMRVNGWPMTGRDIPGTVMIDAVRLSGNEPILVE